MTCKLCGKETKENNELCDNCLKDKARLKQFAHDQIFKNYYDFQSKANGEYLKIKSTLGESYFSSSSYFLSAFLMILEIMGFAFFIILIVTFFAMNFQILADILLAIGFDPKVVTYENGRLVEKYYNNLKVLIIIIAIIDLFITIIIGKIRRELLNKIKMYKIVKSMDKIVNELVNYKLN